MQGRGEDEVAILTVMRVAATREVAALADRLEWDLPHVEVVLDRLESDGLVQERTSAPSGWSLTAAGRRLADRQLAIQVDDPYVRGTVEHLYRRFLTLNPRLLGACTSWQVRTVAGEALVNDHTDEAHDMAAIAELEGVHGDARTVVEELGAVLPGFDGYRRRFDRAIEAVRAGDGAWFASPLVDSYHSAWFELHEHLLALLGLSRSDERPQGGPDTTGAPDAGPQQEETP